MRATIYLGKDAVMSLLGATVAYVVVVLARTSTSLLCLQEGQWLVVFTPYYFRSPHVFNVFLWR